MGDVIGVAASTNSFCYLGDEADFECKFFVFFPQYIMVSFHRFYYYVIQECARVKACLNLVSKVQPFLRTSSDVARLPGSLHHRHSLPLANVAVEITALVRRPLPCRITGKPQHTLASATMHASVCIFYTCVCLPDEEDMVTHILFLGPLIAVPSAQL